MNVKYYLDKPDKNKFYPIHLVIRKKDSQVKASTGEKVRKRDWDPTLQEVKSSEYNHKGINKFLSFLKSEIEKHVRNTPPALITQKSVKEFIVSITTTRKSNNEIVMLKEDEAYYEKRKKITFLDLFAGAGGFSEGFLQAELDNKIYDFLLGSDINENCELTHLARYNFQLGLKSEFLRQDITEPDFLHNLLDKLKGKEVDVVCGGPPCQSFSLAGKRKKFDKKDDLFAHYLNVIKHLRPKYFVMENVKGILTKEKGKIKEMILEEIRSILDLSEFPHLIDFTSRLRRRHQGKAFHLDCLSLRFQFENAEESEIQKLKDNYLSNVEAKFRSVTARIIDYKTSKTDSRILTIRHGLSLLKRENEFAQIRKRIIHEKTFCDLDNDYFINDFNNFLSSIDSEIIIERIKSAFENLAASRKLDVEMKEIITALEIFISSFDGCIELLSSYVNTLNEKAELENILNHIRLYNIESPFVALASNYGVPQNRERVLFIGCRKDQKMIKEIPATVASKDKVTVFEALYDLDFVGNNDEKLYYEDVDLKRKYNGKTEVMKKLLKRRTIDGTITEANGHTYAEWSKKGRLNGRFNDAKKPFYVRNFDELQNVSNHVVAPLHNHKTSNQNKDVIKRLNIILNTGNYSKAKQKLKNDGLESDKRNYNILNPEGQSPTIMTIPDDYIHFSNPRPLTVREMARLQSFDDSFVFQGKRSTGGNKRKIEVPQCTLVGNAVPPLMARAVAMEILKNIK
jgi:DNA (cytosine-5)-methyltransferase 1